MEDLIIRVVIGVPKVINDDGKPGLMIGEGHVRGAGTGKVYLLHETLTPNPPPQPRNRKRVGLNQRDPPEFGMTDCPQWFGNDRLHVGEARVNSQCPSLAGITIIPKYKRGDSKMRIRVCSYVLILLIGMGFVHAVQQVGATGHAQSAPSTWPNILAFHAIESDAAVLLSEVEAGNVTIQLAWQTTGLGPTDRVELDYYRLGSWLPAFEGSTFPLPNSGEIEAPVRPTLDFDPPAFRLKIVNANGELWDEWLLMVPYEIPDDTRPEIEVFDAALDSVALADLQQGTARVRVGWEVKNRLPSSNLVFEQVLQDGSVVPVELPRQKLWVASAADDGILAPVMPLGDNEITLRVRVVDVLTDETYDQAELSLPITGLPATPPPTSRPSSSNNPNTNPPAPTITPNTPPTVTSFTVSPDNVDRGGAITLTWSSTNTTGTALEILKMGEADLGGFPTVFSNPSLPANGTLTLNLPTEIRISARVVLYPVNTTLSNSTIQFSPQWRDVNIHCMATFAVNIGGGCPTDPAITTQAAFQPFEFGSMVWLGNSGAIYVLYNDGSAEYMPEAVYAGLPENTITAPDRLAPIRGFGRVWGNFEWVRNRLGWATAAESGYTATFQGVLVAPDPTYVYTVLFTLPNGQWVGIGGTDRWRNIP